MITIGDLTICPANPAAHSGLMVCPRCGGYGDQPMGIGEDPTDCDVCNGDGSVPGPMPGLMACVRFDGYRSIIRNRLVWRGDITCTDIETQGEFARRLRMYGVTL